VEIILARSIGITRNIDNEISCIKEEAREEEEHSREEKENIMPKGNHPRS
jgi:hypothetical protein